MGDPARTESGLGDGPYRALTSMQDNHATFTKHILSKQTTPSLKPQDDTLR
jgi:hypothetical protein